MKIPGPDRSQLAKSIRSSARNNQITSSLCLFYPILLHTNGPKFNLFHIKAHDFVGNILHLSGHLSFKLE